MSAITGHTVVITGAASGIGKALAEGFLADGARVVAADIQKEGLASLAERGALTQRTDVSSRDQLEELIELTRRETGRIDVLFNNAGFGTRRRIEDLEPGEFERMI